VWRCDYGGGPPTCRVSRVAMRLRRGTADSMPGCPGAVWARRYGGGPPTPRRAVCGAWTRPSPAVTRICFASARRLRRRTADSRPGCPGAVRGEALTAGGPTPSRAVLVQCGRCAYGGGPPTPFRGLRSVQAQLAAKEHREHKRSIVSAILAFYCGKRDNPVQGTSLPRKILPPSNGMSTLPPISFLR
jgi:hypothetical protein